MKQILFTLHRMMPFFFGSLAAIGMASASAHAAAVIEGEGGWLFPGWEGTEQLNRNKIAANIKLIQDTQKVLAAHDIGLLVFVVPAKSPFYPDRLPAQVKVSAQVNTRYQDMMALLTQAGIATFDDKAVLRTVENGTQTAFYRADYHWTAWAAEASADAAANVIRQKWTLPPSDTPGEVLGEWTNERRFGDLAINFMLPEDRRRIGRDVYSVRKLQDKTAGNLLDTGPVRVEIIGNSFVQPYLGFPQKLSNTLNQPVALTWNPGNFGPWKTMLDAAQNADFKQRKLIVWQFNEAQLEHAPSAADIWDSKGVMSVAEWLQKVTHSLSK